jgi:hypothetical protein
VPRALFVQSKALLSITIGRDQFSRRRLANKRWLSHRLVPKTNTNQALR